MNDEQTKSGFATLPMSNARLTREGLELGAHIMKLEADLHACRMHTEYLDQRIVRLANVARDARRLRQAVLHEKECAVYDALQQIAPSILALQPDDFGEEDRDE